MDPLRGIDEIDWGRLHHAYGPATDVPDLLRALHDPQQASADILQTAELRQESVRESVIWTLWGNVYHQGSVWQASATTIPFLFNLLRCAEHAELREFLVCYLHHLAMGYSEDLFPERPTPDADFAAVVGIEDSGAPPRYDGGDDANRGLIWMRDCYEAVETRLGELIEYFDDEDESVRLQAIAAAASFPRKSAISEPKLREVARVGTDVSRGHACLSLAQLAGARAQPLIEAVAHQLRGDSRTMAIAALVVAGAANPDETLIVEFLGAKPGPSAVCVHTDGLAQLVGRCLRLLPPKHGAAGVDALCERLSQALGLANLDITASLLAALFVDSAAPADPSQLTAEQRRGLEAVVEHGAFIIAGSVFANYAEVLRGWGLPSTRAELERYLS